MALVMIAKQQFPFELAATFLRCTFVFFSVDLREFRANQIGHPEFFAHPQWHRFEKRAKARGRVVEISFEQAIEFLKNAAASVRAPEEVTVFDPVPHLLTRRADFERAQIVMQSGSRQALQEFLGLLSKSLFETATRHVRWHVDVDPIEFD